MDRPAIALPTDTAYFLSPSNVNPRCSASKIPEKRAAADSQSDETTWSLCIDRGKTVKSRGFIAVNFRKIPL
ncbi:hypothetical protein KM043_013343 [Ampulex compressa]|nr:hypothetical protein KM043_013343 [Ampulex compressa]